MQPAQHLLLQLCGPLWREGLTEAGVQAVLDQLAQGLLGLLFLVAPDQLAQVLACVAVLA